MLGLLGLGERTTLFYLKKLNTNYKSTRSDDSTCPLLLFNVDFANINKNLPDNFTKLQPILSKHLKKISSLPINKLIIANISLHQNLQYIDLNILKNIKIINPITATIKQLSKTKHKKVFIFASLYSMQANFLKDEFKRANIELITPKKQDMIAIDNIRQLVYKRIESIQNIKKFNALIGQYSSKYPVVIACTELSIIVSSLDNLDIYDMAKIQINKILK